MNFVKQDEIRVVLLTRHRYTLSSSRLSQYTVEVPTHSLRTLSALSISSLFLLALIKLSPTTRRRRHTGRGGSVQTVCSGLTVRQIGFPPFTQHAARVLLAGLEQLCRGRVLLFIRIFGTRARMWKGWGASSAGCADPLTPFFSPSQPLRPLSRLRLPSASLTTSAMS